MIQRDETVILIVIIVSLIIRHRVILNIDSRWTIHFHADVCLISLKPVHIIEFRTAISNYGQ